MKKFLNYQLKLSESTVVAGFLFWMAILFVLYLACVAYITIRFMDSAPVQPKDVVVLYSGIRLHRKVVPYLRNKVFVRR